MSITKTKTKDMILAGEIRRAIAPVSHMETDYRPHMHINHLPYEQLLTDRDRLAAENKALREALEPWAKIVLLEMGNPRCDKARDDFLRECPEYIGYCRNAQAALAKAKGAT